jgi:hypothetical protein
VCFCDKGKEAAVVSVEACALMFYGFRKQECQQLHHDSTALPNLRRIVHSEVYYFQPPLYSADKMNTKWGL